MLRFEDALSRILALGHPVLPSERVPLDALDGRFIAEDLIAAENLPRFDHSAMDGYAVRLADLDLAGLVGQTWRLPVRGESRSGTLPDALSDRTTMRIFTGAALPVGADAVVMQEDVLMDGDSALFTALPRVGQHIRRRGQDLAAGTLAIAQGTRLRPVHLALAASLDRAELAVARKPSVLLVATGDELRPPGSPMVAGTIPESNTALLRSMAERAGARARVLPLVRDDRSAIEHAFASALEDADVVVTIGGVSVGDHDLVRPALVSVGVDLDFWRVAMKPGKPLAVGRFARSGRRDAIVLGLPGNPASAMVTFGLFGVPLLRAMQGDAHPFPTARRARMAHDYAHDRGRTEFVRATMSHHDGRLVVSPLDNQASGAVTAMAKADVLALVPADVDEVPAGAEVDVLFMGDLST